MKRYDFVLFDADNTLFDFDRAEHEALRLALEAFSIPCTPETEARYVSINSGLWAMLDRGEATREWLVVERFARLTRELGVEADPQALNRTYLDKLGEQPFLLPGAEKMCRALGQHCTLAILTNGVARAQRGRFDRSPLAGLIPHLFISEEVGASKPSPAFFRPVLDALGVTNPRRALMVGDNLTTDIGAPPPWGWIPPGTTPAACPIPGLYAPPGRLPGWPSCPPWHWVFPDFPFNRGAFSCPARFTVS